MTEFWKGFLVATSIFGWPLFILGILYIKYLRKR